MENDKKTIGNGWKEGKGELEIRMTVFDMLLYGRPTNSLGYIIISAFHSKCKCSKLECVAKPSVTSPFSVPQTRNFCGNKRKFRYLGNSRRLAGASLNDTIKLADP